MTKLTEVTIETVAKGAAPEVFQHEFEKVLHDIRDLNKDPEAVRSITMTFKFRPLKSREEAQVRLDVRTKLADLTPVVGSHMFIGRRGGELVATTHDVQQEDLGFDDASPRETADRETGEVLELPTHRNVGA